MAELANCSRCNDVFVKGIRDICQKCYKEEEKVFEIVYRFLRERKNREATMEEIIKATGAKEAFIIKFIREKRLHPSQFPKLAYSCERCGTSIVSGHLCENCTKELRNDLLRHEELEKLAQSDKNKEKNTIYYNFEKK
ncbi:hypothetical protein CIL03_10995 [Virgibacillus indicus]|uniref:Flagellar protein n=1 Tax=Virgibacillus indicus TaxID=2024554 RepID=A0A265N9X6_9BACI|nr:TIGR03826 family flagellar region protein [Virgibacillus indicus]OZU88803.1 hypothetical protein CIL03_10995 [Virgibacillus indicus]